MTRRTVFLGVTLAAFAAVAVRVGITTPAQKPPLLVRSAIAGQVVAEGLVKVNQDVKQGDPLVYVLSTIETRPVLAAVAPVDGRVVRVTVKPGSHVNIGETVTAIQEP